MKKIKLTISKRIADHLIQAILIFASVVVAFWLTDYRQVQNENQQVRIAIESVVNEISTNRNILKRTMPALQSTISRTEEFLAKSLDTAKVFNDYYLTAGKLRFNELLTDDSYLYLNQNNIYVEVKKRLLINRIYKQQGYVESAISELIQFYKQRDLFDNNKVRENYIIFYRTLKEMEGQIIAMIREYDLALNELAD